MLMPRFSAYRSPRSSALSGLMRLMAIPIPISMRVAKSGMLLRDTPPKFPIPHIKYDCTPSAVEKKLSSETADDTIYPIIMPMMSSMAWLRSRAAKNMMISVTNNAPIKAAPTKASEPPRYRLPVGTNPPKSSNTIAAPSPAPALMPSTSGPAKGLLNAVCSIRPAAANAAPDNNAVSAWGRRDSRMIYPHDAFSGSPPKRMLMTSPMGMCTEP